MYGSRNFARHTKYKVAYRKLIDDSYRDSKSENNNNDEEPQHGYYEEFFKGGRIMSKGHYKDGKKVGVWWFYQEDGGALVGKLDDRGTLTGNDIAYMYPDRWTALVGEFEEGIMKKAKLARLKTMVDGIPSFYFMPSETEFTVDHSTRTVISTYPLVPDPYETERVYVKQSGFDGAGEGVFARMAVGTGTTMAFYNGVRVHEDELTNREWSESIYTMELDDTHVLDIPEEYASLENYCATLGHKLNHSFTPNCFCDSFEHPRFGSIMRIETAAPLKKDEELTINYGYGPRIVGDDEINVPPWYKEKMPYFLCMEEKSNGVN